MIGSSSSGLTLEMSKNSISSHSWSLPELGSGRQEECGCGTLPDKCGTREALVSSITSIESVSR